MTNLRDRARGQQDPPGNELERRDALRADILRMESAFAAALPSGVEARQIVRDAMTVMQSSVTERSNGLYGVDKMSLLGALMTCSQLALRPGVLGQAYVLPFKGRAQFVAGYHGLKDIGHRSQMIRDIVAEPVRDQDEFDFQRGSKPSVHHKINPRLSPEDRGPIYGYYAVVTTIHGGTYLDYMTDGELDAHRDRYAMARKGGPGGPIVGPWVDPLQTIGMRQKTVLKRALKLAPRSLEMQAVQIHDESVRTEVRALDLNQATRSEAGDVSWPPDAGGDDVVDGVVEDDVEAQVRRSDPT